MTTNVESVHVLDEPGLYRALSSSSTVYYVNTTDTTSRPRFLRARGGGATKHGYFDDSWEVLTGLNCFPLIEGAGMSMVDAREQAEPWTLRPGRRHEYTGKDYGGLDGTDFWYVGRVVERIERLDEMPPDGELTVEERLSLDDLDSASLPTESPADWDGVTGDGLDDENPK